MDTPIVQSFPKSLAPWMDLLGVLGVAAEKAARQASRATFRAIDRRGRGKALPGAGALADSEAADAASATPMWNVLSAELDKALKTPGARARLARYLGVPRQRITDFTKGRRLPDGETTLRLLHWLAATQAGQDPSFLVLADPAAEASAKG